MEARAYLKYARIAPRKVQIVLNLIRGKDVELARAILKHTPKAACEPLEKLLKSAVANAENNFNMDKNNLYVAECFVCPGPTLKRIRPRAQGRAFHVLKRTSHVTMVLNREDIDPEVIFAAELIGVEVFENGVKIGDITEVLDYPGNSVYVVKGEKSYMIPAVKAFILNTDIDGNRMDVKLLEGMEFDAG